MSKMKYREIVCIRCYKPFQVWKREASICPSCSYASRRAGHLAKRVSGASDCSDPLRGADNRAALAAKRPIPPRVAGRNPAVDRRPTGKGEKQ